MELPDGTVTRCPYCHPLSSRSLTALMDERSRLLEELRRVEAALEEAQRAAEVPPWVRGPGAG